MAGLTILALAALAALPLPAQESWKERGERLAVERLETWLEHSAAAAEPSWQRAVFQLLRRLDHSADPRVHDAWLRLAEGGGDLPLANLLLYERRHGIQSNTLPPLDAAPGPEYHLEWALAAWGRSDLAAARAAFAAGCTAFPDHDVMHRNLLWLDLSPPPRLSLSDDPRAMALAVLALRAAR